MNKEQLKAWYREFKEVLTQAGVDLNDKRDLMRLRIIMPDMLEDPFGDKYETEGCAFIPKTKDGHYINEPYIDEESEREVSIRSNEHADAAWEYYEVSKSRLQEIAWEYDSQRLFDENNDKDLKQIEHLYNKVASGQVLLQDRTCDVTAIRQLYIGEDDKIHLGPKAGEYDRIFNHDGDLHTPMAEARRMLRAQGTDLDSLPGKEELKTVNAFLTQLNNRKLREVLHYDPKGDINDIYFKGERMASAVQGQTGGQGVNYSIAKQLASTALAERFEHPEYFNENGTYTDLGFEKRMPIYRKEEVTKELSSVSIEITLQKLFTTLDDADPSLMRSHKEFRDLKAAVKDLADNSEQYDRAELDEKINNTIHLANDYLRSKQKPGVSLSSTTFKRISAVADVRSRLMATRDLRLEKQKDYEKRRKYDEAGTRERNEATIATLREKTEAAKNTLRNLTDQIRQGNAAAIPDPNEAIRTALGDLMFCRMTQKSLDDADNQMARDSIEALLSDPASPNKLLSSNAFKEFYPSIPIGTVIEIANEEGGALLDEKISQFIRKPGAKEHNNGLVCAIAGFYTNERQNSPDDFFYESVKEGMDQKDNKLFGITTDRAGRSAVAMAKLLNDGYAIEDILDPYKLYTVKQEAGREVLRHLVDTPDNFRWVAEQLYKGTAKLTQHLSELVNKLPDREPGYAESKEGMLLYSCGSVLQNLAQERDHRDMANYLDKTYGDEFRNTGGTAYRITNIITTYFDPYKAAALLMIKDTGKDSIIAKVAAKIAFEKQLKEESKKEGGVMENLSEKDISDYTIMKTCLVADPHIDGYTRHLDTLQHRTELCNDIFSGELMKKTAEEANVLRSPNGDLYLDMKLKPCPYGRQPVQPQAEGPERIL